MTATIHQFRPRSTAQVIPIRAIAPTLTDAHMQCFNTLQILFSHSREGCQMATRQLRAIAASTGEPVIARMVRNFLDEVEPVQPPCEVEMPGGVV